MRAIRQWIGVRRTVGIPPFSIGEVRHYHERGIAISPTRQDIAIFIPILRPWQPLRHGYPFIAHKSSHGLVCFRHHADSAYLLVLLLRDRELQIQRILLEQLCKTLALVERLPIVRIAGHDL